VARTPVPSAIRYRVAPRDVPPVKAARRLHLTLAEFRGMLPALAARGFPAPDPTTGMYDLAAIDAWMDRRHATTQGGAQDASLTGPSPLRNAQEVFRDRARRAADGAG
jgi:hypothetical protein